MTSFDFPPMTDRKSAVHLHIDIGRPDLSQDAPAAGTFRRPGTVTVAGWPGSSSTSPRCGSTATSGACGPARWSPGMGSQLTLVAVSFQAYALTHSTLVVGLIGLAQLVPLLAGALWGGTLADAMDRRKVLILTQVAMATAVGGLVVNASLTHPAVWPLFVCTGPAPGSRGSTGRRGGPRCPCWWTRGRDRGHRPADHHPAAGPGGRAGPGRHAHRHHRAERGLRHRRGHLRRGPGGRRSCCRPWSRPAGARRWACGRWPRGSGISATRSCCRPPTGSTSTP